MENWPDLSFDDFSKELSKLVKPRKLSLSEKSEWFEHFEKERAKAIKIDAQIMASNDKTEQMIYELYEFTESEIKLIENFSQKL